MQQPALIKTDIKPARQKFAGDRAAFAMVVLAMAYLAAGLLFGLLGGFQYILPEFLKEKLAFQKIRPLHVYLAISWIFTAAQGGIYYYIQRIRNRDLCWTAGAWIHFYLQLVTSALIVMAFFAGKFGGREYLEFPPELGVLVAASWIPFAINFFGTLKPNLKTAPVYYFSWTTGIIFFFITLSESYLWVFDHFNQNIIRDTTVQWKALGSMVGSWNMLVFGTTIYLMERMNKDFRVSRSKSVFFFFFLGFANLLFNWGHHTYVVPAAPYVKNIAYIISMTELLIFGQIIWKFRQSYKQARLNFNNLSYRLISFADIWIFLNLGVAIALSVPSINQYTHGTHITVAHAMGTTIGINTMLLFASVFYMIRLKRKDEIKSRWASRGIVITNISLMIFWTSLIGSGLYKISGQLEQKTFAAIMKGSIPFFKMFTASGVFILLGLFMMILGAGYLIFAGRNHSMKAGRNLVLEER